MSPQDPHNFGPVLRDGDPDDPPPRSRPVAMIQTELRDGDPDDPPPRSRPVSKLAAGGKAPRTQGVRRDRPAAKPAKRRAGSRRR